MEQGRRTAQERRRETPEIKMGHECHHQPPSPYSARRERERERPQTNAKGKDFLILYISCSHFASGRLGGASFSFLFLHFSPFLSPPRFLDSATRSSRSFLELPRVLHFRFSSLLPLVYLFHTSFSASRFAKVRSN